MEEILKKAERLEKEYEWPRAAESYDEAFNLLSEDNFLLKGKTREQTGYALYRAAFQAESSDDFKERLHRAILSYQQAKELYGRLDDQLKTPRMRRCDAMTALMDYWLAEKPSEKKKLLDECWELTKDSLEGFGLGNAVDYGKTFNELSASVDLGYFFHENPQIRKR